MCNYLGKREHLVCMQKSLLCRAPSDGYQGGSNLIHTPFSGQQVELGRRISCVLQFNPDAQRIDILFGFRRQGTH